MAAPIVIADDHPLFRAALRRAVETAAPDRDVFECETLAGALEHLARGPVGLLTLDLHMPDSDGLAGLLRIRSEHPAVPVVVVSGDTGPGLPGRVAAHGASGFVHKSSDLDTMTEAMATVLDGDLWLPTEPAELPPEENALRTLTPTQMKVLLYVRDGLLNKQIAYAMDVSEATVKAHMTSVMQKLGVQTRTQAALIAQSLTVRPSEREEG